MKFVDLPINMVLEICRQMDIQTLRNFIKTSKIYSKTGKDVLEIKVREFVGQILELAKNTYKQIIINSSTSRHKFSVEANCIGAGFSLHEYVLQDKPLFLLEKFSWGELDRLSVRWLNYLSEDRIKEILLDLFLKGCLNDYYLPPNRTNNPFVKQDE